MEAGPVTTVYPTQVKVHANTRAIQLLATQHQLLISHAGQKQRLSYDKLILAPGAQATIPAVLSTTSQNVLPMRTRAQINHLKAATTDATIHHVIVIGGGYIGVGAADLFSQHGKQVTVIEHGPQLLGSYLDNDFSMPIQQALQQQGVTVHVNELVTGLTGAPDVTGVTTNQTTLSADLVVVATGTTLTRTGYKTSSIVYPMVSLKPMLICRPVQLTYSLLGMQLPSLICLSTSHEVLL
ncbi:FAD-dependent oxidoreductase [Levilactobacillus brevis]|nr:FAD-dependent oxidoreductase [Levilactobacillus brevis]